jgi:hypothetical protein
MGNTRTCAGVALRVTVEEPAPAPDNGPADVLVVTIAFHELSGPIPQVHRVQRAQARLLQHTANGG